MDDLDRASERETFDREQALAAVRARLDAAAASHGAALNGLCIDCGEAIEPARLAALRGCTSRCADCATQFEQRQRMAR